MAMSGHSSHRTGDIPYSIVYVGSGSFWMRATTSYLCGRSFKLHIGNAYITRRGPEPRGSAHPLAHTPSVIEAAELR